LKLIRPSFLCIDNLSFAWATYLLKKIFDFWKLIACLDAYSFTAIIFVIIIALEVSTLKNGYLQMKGKKL